MPGVFNVQRGVMLGQYHRYLSHMRLTSIYTDLSYTT